MISNEIQTGFHLYRVECLIPPSQVVPAWRTMAPSPILPQISNFLGRVAEAHSGPFYILYPVGLAVRCLRLAYAGSLVGMLMLMIVIHCNKYMYVLILII